MNNNSSERIYDQLVRRAEDFYQSGQFLEAFLIQSCVIEGVVKNCVFIHFRDLLIKDHELSNSFERWQISKLLDLLLITGIIKHDLFKKLEQYTRQRNKVVHQILTYDAKKRDAVLKTAYRAGKEMKTFIVGDLIMGKLDKNFKELEKAVDDTIKLVANQNGMTPNEFLEKYDVTVRPKTGV